MPAVRIAQDPLQRLTFVDADSGQPVEGTAARSDGGHELVFAEWLRNQAEIELTLALYDEPIRISSEAPAALESILSCDLRERTVHATLLIFDTRTRDRQNHVKFIGKHLIYLPADARLGVLENPEILQRWRKMERTVGNSAGTSLLISAEGWNQHLIPPFDNLTLRCESAPALAEKAKPEAKLVMNRLPDGKRIAIHPSAKIDGIALPTLAPALEKLLAFRWKAPERLFQSHERSLALFRALGETLISETPEQVLAGLGTSANIRGTPFAETGPEWVRRTAESIDDRKAAMVVAAPESERRPWMRVDAPSAAPRNLIGLLLSVCEVEVTPVQQRAALFVSAMDILRALPILVERGQKLGVVVEFENAPVIRADIKVKVEAEKEEKIDWFELRPEIAIGGRYLSESEWRNFLEQRVMPTEDGGWQVLDEAGAFALRKVANAIDAHRASRPFELTPVQAVHPMAWRLRLLDWLAFKRAGISLQLPEEDQSVLESLLSFNALQTMPTPRGLNAQLRDYQRAGYSWLCFLYKHRLGAILADDMGLGKTLQTIAFLGAIREGILPRPEPAKPHLLVLPPILLFNWRSELKTFYPEFKVGDLGVSGNYDIYLASYESVRRNIDAIQPMEFDVVVFDEAQHVKNHASNRSKAMRRIQANFKLCLTGTPVENHSGEYFAIVDLALPGLLGEYKGGEVVENFVSDDMFERAKPFVLRRTKEKILKELPPKVESEIHLELSPDQKSLYTRTVDEVRQEVEEAYEEKTKGQAGIMALTALTRLRQICVSPRLVDPKRTEPSPKMEYLCDTLEQLMSEGHCALIFTQFIGALNVIQETMKQRGLTNLRLDGATPHAKRKTYVETFQNSTEPMALLISLRTGSAGLNLTRAGYVFHVDPWWNPAVEAQATDRAHRMGQKNQVMVHRLVMKHTVEEKIMMLKTRKKALYERMLSGRENPTTGSLITRSDFDFLLG